MTVLLTPPQAPPEPAPVNERVRGPRRRGWVVTALALALVVGAAICSLLLWALSTVHFSTDGTRFAGSADVVTVPGYGPRGTHIVDYRDGADLTVTLPVRNSGPLPVDVTSATTGAGLLPLLAVRSVELPATLAPGEQGEIVLHATLANCAYYHEREVQNVADLTLGVEIAAGPLHRATEVVLPLDRPLLVHSPMIVGCPERKIDRQADNRRDAL